LEKHQGDDLVRELDLQDLPPPTPAKIPETKIEPEVIKEVVSPPNNP